VAVTANPPASTWRRISRVTLDRSDRASELNLTAHVTSRQSWGVSAGQAGQANIELKNGWLPLRRGDWQVNSIDTGGRLVEPPIPEYGPCRRRGRSCSAAGGS